MILRTIGMIRLFVIAALSASLVLCVCCSRQGTDAANTGAEQQNPVNAAELTDANEALAAGNQLLENNRTEEAIQAFLRATELNPDLGEAFFQLGIAYSLLEKEKKIAAMEDVNATENTNGKKPPATDSEKAFRKAVEAYKRILADNPDDDVSQFNLGRALNKLNEDTEAAKALKQAVKLKPDDAEYQTELGAILIKLAQYHEAIPPLKKALELDPENSRAADLLEDAQAGRSRIDYAQSQKDTAKNANVANANSNTAIDANANTNTAPTNTNMSKPVGPAKSPSPEKKKTPKPANRPD
jgi:tetratricopeptide (TPR) repeat protein